MHAAFHTWIRPSIDKLLLRWRMRSQHSHCELIVSDGPAAVSSFLEGGVYFKPIEFDPGHRDRVDLVACIELAALLNQPASAGIFTRACHVD